MCDYVKVVPVTFTDEEGTDTFKLVVPCGKCYDCMRSLANQFVLRCNSEYVHSSSTFFVTLTYEDKNLRYMYPSRVERGKALQKLSEYPSKVFGMYDEFVLDKEDVVSFRKSLQKCLKRYSDSLLFRYVINGEYGTFTHRPHYHALIFSPLYFNVFDFLKIIQECWKLGNVTVSEVTPSRINYCAKHCMKEDRGCELQQEIAPIFQRRSTYLGGIGRDLVNDESILSNYRRGLNFFQTGRYKINIPRYIRKKLSPERKTRSELEHLEKQSFDSLVYRISQDVMYCVQSDFNYNFTSSLHDRIDFAVQLFRSVNYDSVVSELRDFYDRKFWSHINRLRSKENVVC